MINFIRILSGILLFVSFFTGSFSASGLNPADKRDNILYLDTAKADIDNYLSLFARELSADAFSDRSSEMFNYLLEYIEGNQDLSHEVNARLNRYMGGYRYYHGHYDDALEYYTKSLKSYMQAETPDTAGLSTIFSQLGLTYYYIDRYKDGVTYLENSIKQRELYYGKKSSNLVRPLASLSAIYIDGGEYDKARERALRGINIVEESGGGQSSLGNLYYNLGGYYSKRGDYNNAKSMYQVAEQSQIEYDPADQEMLLYIVNGISVANRMTGDTLEAISSYEKMIRLLENISHAPGSGDIYFTNYAHFLAMAGRLDEALDIFKRAVKYSSNNYGDKSERYMIARENLAYFYNSYAGDIETAYGIYSDLYADVDKNDYGIVIKNDIKTGLASVKVERGELEEALKLYNEVLESGEIFSPPKLLYIYSYRSSIYREKYLEDSSAADLDNALSDIDAAIHVLDSVKIDFTGEESRLQITGRFDFLWDNAVWLAAEKYRIKNDPAYFNKAFRYSEKSKASTLLSSTREVQAMDFHVPPELVRLEKGLDHFIKELDDKIYNITNSANTNDSIVSFYEGERTEAVIKRDSLIRLFERDYPRYYSLKHEDKVASCRDVVNYLGRNRDFIEFFLSDSILYTFIINRKGCSLIDTPVDSLSRKLILDFRSDIINPAIENGARAQFDRIVRNGNYLHNLLIEPVKEYLVSRNIVIATDDILSYIPFEALIADTSGLRPINYRDIDFLFKKFEITYTYSSSLLLETEGKGRSITNHALIFAPTYAAGTDTDSLLMSRQMERGPLNNIPGAKEEAIYISSLLGGKLYLENQASEQRFISECAGEKIIHLAMHTLINDKEPMLSKMVFTQNSDTIENGLLNTYEIYNLDLDDAKMLVLSSCNTGAGYLQSGEGVISLARGFMYAGSPSVVMSLWEVDDYSGSEIIKDFYSNLKKGYSKSEALKRARSGYLKSADQLRSHPYFWCSLVILGEDEPLYYNRLRIGLIVLLLSSVIFVWRRHYRPKPS